MKKLAFGIGVLLLLAIVLPAMAAPAQVVKDVDCKVPNAVGGLIATTGKEVATSSGNSMIVCKAQLNPLTDVFPAKAVKWDFASLGLKCWTGFGLTENWQAVITPSGQVSMTCHYKTP
jgi:hypothetical protein